MRRSYASGGGDVDLSKCIRFTSTSLSEVGFAVNSETYANTFTFEYSLDGRTWQTWQQGAAGWFSPQFSDTFYVRGINNKFAFGNSSSPTNSARFYVFYDDPGYGPCYVDGNIDSLINYEGLDGYSYASGQFANLFYECGGGILSAPELPQETLSAGCYQSMFYKCTALTKGPHLPAKTLYASAYRNMFQGCTSLNEIWVAATSIPDSSSTNNWLYQVQESGTFHCATGATWSSGQSGCPSGWTKVTDYNG